MADEVEHLLGLKLLRISATLLMLLVAPSAVAQAAGSSVDQKWMGAVATYETPCYHRARVARGIPPLEADSSRGYLAWYRAHWGNPEWTEWNTAAVACDRDLRTWDVSQLMLAWEGE
jgi:hypothetical protein